MYFAQAYVLYDLRGQVHSLHFTTGTNQVLYIRFRMAV